LGDAVGVITERSLLSFSNILEQPSPDFPGETERIELSGGIPVRSTVYVNGKKVSETEFRSGRPHIQYLDLDMDGRMETRRRYDPDVPYRILITESDWNGDGTYEYAETLQSDGSIIKSWDFNRDGIRETQR
jgi:antitoxin component YwqK of YwqJK toxin-antitoxin module